jgi:hypothetical protein
MFGLMMLLVSIQAIEAFIDVDQCILCTKEAGHNYCYEKGIEAFIGVKEQNGTNSVAFSVLFNTTKCWMEVEMVDTGQRANISSTASASIEASNDDEGLTLRPLHSSNTILELTIQNYVGLIRMHFKDQVTRNYFVIDDRPPDWRLSKMTKLANGTGWKISEDRYFARCLRFNTRIVKNNNTLMQNQNDSIYNECVNANSTEEYTCTDGQVEAKYSEDKVWSFQVLDNQVNQVSVFCDYIKPDKQYKKEVKKEKVSYWQRNDLKPQTPIRKKVTHQDKEPIYVGLVILCLCLGILVGYVIVKKHFRTVKKSRQRLLSIVSKSTTSTVEDANRNDDEELGLIENCRNFNIDNVQIGPELGRGHYGVVKRATLVDESARWDVAVKMSINDLGMVSKIFLSGFFL